MTYALDVNPLVYSADSFSPFYERARAAIANIYAGVDLVYLFWPVALGFLRISTNPRASQGPLSQAVAIEAISRLIALPNVRTGSENQDFWAELQAVTRGLVVRGKLFPDAHIVTLMRIHGVSTILTHDRDFRKFDGVRIVDPFQ